MRGFIDSTQREVVKVMGIPSAQRPCVLKAGCRGLMYASLRQYVGSDIPELWWRCDECKTDARRGKVDAKPAATSDAEIAEAEISEETARALMGWDAGE